MWASRFRTARASLVRHNSFASARSIVAISIFVVSSSYLSIENELLRILLSVGLFDSAIKLEYSCFVLERVSSFILCQIRFTCAWTKGCRDRSAHARIHLSTLQRRSLMNDSCSSLPANMTSEISGCIVSSRYRSFVLSNDDPRSCSFK